MNQDNKVIMDDSEEISLKEFILKIQDWCRFLLSKWVVILIAGIIGGAIGFTYAYFKKPVYKAEFSFALEDDKPSSGLGAAMGLATQFGLDLGGGGGSAFSGDNLLELIKSRSIIEKTLLSSVNVVGKKTTLIEYYIAINKFRETWQNDTALKKINFLPDADRSKFTRAQDSVIGSFYRNLSKGNLFIDKLDKKLSIITVRVNTENELFSKLFAEELVKTVSSFYVDTKTKKSAQTVSILEHQIDSVRHELNAAIVSVASSADHTPNSNPALQILKTPAQRRQVDVQANTAILTELVKSLEMSKMSLRKETPLVQIIDKPILPLEKEKIGKARGLVLGGIIGGFLMIIMLSFKLVKIT